MPRMTPHGFAYVAFREHEQGASSRALFTSPVWRRWLLDAARVAELFNQAERIGVLRFSQAGSAVRVDWRVGSLEEVARAAASSLVNVGDRVVDFFDRGGDAPYLLYVYKPSEEYAVRRDLGELRLWLEAKQVNCVPISLATSSGKHSKSLDGSSLCLRKSAVPKAIPRPGPDHRIGW